MILLSDFILKIKKHGALSRQRYPSKIIWKIGGKMKAFIETSSPQPEMVCTVMLYSCNNYLKAKDKINARSKINAFMTLSTNELTVTLSASRK